MLTVSYDLLYTTIKEMVNEATDYDDLKPEKIITRKTSAKFSVKKQTLPEKKLPAFLKGYVPKK